MSADKRIWPGGLTTEEVMAEVMKGYYREERRMEAEAAKRKAREQARTQKVVEFPQKLSDHELMRRQAIIDQTWERMLLEKELLREEALRRSFHKAPGDPDWSA
jgi:hypothetical protein